jgi:hypothetical protein
MVQVLADVTQVLLPLVLRAFEEIIQLRLLPLVLTQYVHGLSQFEM